MEIYGYINPSSANPTKWSNACKISFNFTVRENLYSQNFQKFAIWKEKCTRNTIFSLVKINPLEN